MKMALAGNQNCGKTTLFNRLTGSAQHVGNWPGVTVEKKTGSLLPKLRPADAPTVQVVDLPGVYSLAPFSQEEAVTRRFLLDEGADVIVNVVDAAHLERNLYLTLQLLQLGKPMVVALNMMDELAAQGARLDLPALEKQLRVPVVPLCARTGQGIETLTAQACQVAALGLCSPPSDFLTGPARLAQQEMARLVSNQRTAHLEATALLEEEADTARRLLNNPALWPKAEAIRHRLEAQTGLPAPAALAAGRYAWLEGVLARCYQPGQEARHQADHLLVRSVLSVPLFVAVVALVFFLSFGGPGNWLAQGLTRLLDEATQELDALLRSLQVAPGLRALLVEGLLPGLGSVLGFLPPLLMLLFLTSLLEDSGYLARAAFLMDRPLRAIGLSGRSLIPLALGFGCTVPAVLSARSLKSPRDRCLTVLLTPLMSCGAKVPVYAMLAHWFFPEHQALVMMGLYGLGILLAALAGLMLKGAVFPGEPEPFVLELPAYRWPSLRNAFGEMGHRCKEFLARTCSVILLATLGIWFLSRFTPGLRPAPSLEQSLLGLVAGWLAPLFRPCGFGHPAAVAALLTGLLAKESIASTLSVLSGLTAFPSGLSALAFLAFVLLYPPCAAAMATIRRELNSPRLAAGLAMAQWLLAWAVATLVYQLGSLL